MTTTDEPNFIVAVLCSDWVTKTIPSRYRPDIDDKNNLHVNIHPKGGVVYANGTWKSFTVDTFNEKDS